MGGGLRRGLAAPFLLAYGAAALLIVALVHYGGVWNVLANTRLLDPLISGGVVALTDQDVGVITGVPDMEYYVRSQDPVDWELVLLAGGMLTLLWGLKAYQFHALSRFAGLDGGFGQHMRAYLHGRGLNRILPYDVGSLATASTLQLQGAELDRANSVVFMSKLFTFFEVVFFALIGLYMGGVTTWAGEIFWPLVILGCAFFVVRPGRDRHGRGALRAAAKQGVRALAEEPALLIRLCLLSIGAFLLADEAAYLIAQAFTSQHVILNIEGEVILMAVVGGQVARLVQFTPGGIGQYEWGFAAALYVGGVGFPEAATVALLVGFFRYVTGGLVFGALMLTRGVESNMRYVLGLFRRPRAGEAA
jgi:uncharacterized membrane protein YbhN (UPF0104 family)